MKITPFMIKRFLILSIIVPAIAISFPTVSLFAETLTIQKALSIAFEHNREYLRAVEELDKASAGIKQARSGAFPKISFKGIYSRNWEPNEFVISMGGVPQHLKIGTDNTFSAGLNFTQPLWLGGKVFTALKIAKIYKKYSQENLISVYNKVRLDVYRRFYGFILTEELVRIAEQANKQAEASRKVVEKMHSQGMVSDYDLLRAKVAEQNTVPELIKARSTASIAADALKSILGMELSSDIEPIAEYDFSGIDTILAQPADYYLNFTLNNRSDVKGLNYRIEMLNKNISIEKSAYYPSLIFSTDLMWQLQRDDWDIDPEYWTRSINSSLILQIPIFEGFGRSAKVKQAKIDKQQAQLQYQQFKDAVKLEVNSAYGNLKEAYKRLNSQKNTVEMAQEGFRIAELRYENGVGTQLEVIDARTALVQAEVFLANAKHDVIVSKAEFEKAIGVIKPKE